jgi:hypothetical protein
MCAGSPLFAQTGASADAGVAIVRFPEERTTIAGPWLRRAAGRDTLDLLARASANLIVVPGALAGSGDASAWWRAVLGRGWAWEAGGEASALFGSTSHASANLLAGARLFRAVGPSGGVWLRGVGHGAQREAGTLGGATIDAAAWTRAPFGTVGVSVLRESTRGQLFAGAGGGVVVGTVPVRFVEAAVMAAGDASDASFELVAGVRRDPDAAERLEALASAGVLLWLSPSRAITVSVARQPADFVHGADAARSVSVGLHFGDRPRPAGLRRRTMPAGPTLHVLAGAAGTQRIVVLAPGASTVEVMADFTGWEPVALGLHDDGFALELPIAPGTHRVAIRVNGGPWMAPSNMPAIDDDFGGRVGLVTTATR